MIAEMIKERNLPEFRSREEMMDLLMKNEYGYFPNIPYEISVSEPRISTCATAARSVLTSCPVTTGRSIWPISASIWMTNRKPRNCVPGFFFIRKTGHLAGAG